MLLGQVGVQGRKQGKCTVMEQSSVALGADCWCLLGLGSVSLCGNAAYIGCLTNPPVLHNPCARRLLVNAWMLQSIVALNLGADSCLQRRTRMHKRGCGLEMDLSWLVLMLLRVGKRGVCWCTAVHPRMRRCFSEAVHGLLFVDTLPMLQICS